jgi:hypothetical protein
MQDYVHGEMTLQVDNINRLYHVLDPEQQGYEIITTPNSDIIRIQYNMPYSEMAILEKNLRSTGNFVKFIANIPDNNGNGNGDQPVQDYQGEEYFTSPQGGAMEYPEEHQYDHGQNVEYANTGYSGVYEETYNQPPVGANQQGQYYEAVDNQFQQMNQGRKQPMQGQNPQLRPGQGMNQPPAAVKRGGQYSGQGELLRGNPNLYDQKQLPPGQNFKPYANQPQQPQNLQYPAGAKQQPMRRPVPGEYPDNQREQYYDEQAGYFRDVDQQEYYPDQQLKGARPQAPQGKLQPAMGTMQPQGGRFPQGAKQPPANPAPQMMPGNQAQPYYGKGPAPQQQQPRGYPGAPQQRYIAGQGEQPQGYLQDFRQTGTAAQYQEDAQIQGYAQQYPQRGQEKWNQPLSGGKDSGSNQGPGSKNSQSSGAQKSQGKQQGQNPQNTTDVHGHSTGVSLVDKRGSGQQHVRGASANVPRGGHQGTGPNSSAGSQSGRGGHPAPVQSVAGQLHSSQKIKQQQPAAQSQQWGAKGNKKGLRDDGSVSSQSIGQSAGPESFTGSIHPTGPVNPQRRGNQGEDFGSPAISPPPTKDINLPKERFIDDTVENINRKPGFNKAKKKCTRRAQLLEEYLRGLATGAEPAPQHLTSIGSISNMRVDMGSNVFVSSVALTESNKVDTSQPLSSPSVPHLDFTEQFDEEEDEERRRRDADRAKQAASSGPLRQPLGEVGESDEINNDPEEQLESEGEEEDFFDEEQFDPELGEEEQAPAPAIKEKPVAGGRFLATPGLQVSEVSKPKITNKGKPQLQASKTAPKGTTPQ